MHVNANRILHPGPIPRDSTTACAGAGSTFGKPASEAVAVPLNPSL
jgi:hypothetical protein